MDREKDILASSSHTLFVPVLLIVIGLLLMTGFQSIQLSREFDLLKQRQEAQATPLEESQSVRDQLQAIATSTKQLAEAGNQNAQRIVEQLERAGITINVDGS